MTPAERHPAPSGVYGAVKRIADILTALVGLVLFSPALALIWMVIRLESPGPGIFRQRRIGRWGEGFQILKFRTMRTDAPDVATHELTERESYVTPLGRFLRRSSLDEVPQLWNVLTGEMSIVGPRPALWSQRDLTSARHERGIDALRPGLTGLAQVKGRDDLSISEKVAYDEQYLQSVGIVTDVRILWLSVAAVFTSRGVH